jgi:hypothetical protein
MLVERDGCGIVPGVYVLVRGSVLSSGFGPRKDLMGGVLGVRVSIGRGHRQVGNVEVVLIREGSEFGRDSSSVRWSAKAKCVAVRDAGTVGRGGGAKVIAVGGR